MPQLQFLCQNLFLTLQLKKCLIEKKIEEHSSLFYKIFDNNFVELVTLTINTVRLSEDTKLPREETNDFLSKIIGNEVVTLTSEATYSEDKLQTKIQAKFDKSEQSFEQQQ